MKEAKPFFFVAIIFGNSVFSQLGIGGDTISLLLPPRHSEAISGKEFIDTSKHMSHQQREDAIYKEIMDGNMPEYLKTLVPVEFTAQCENEEFLVKIWVIPDYLSIGSAEDSVRMPMNLYTAASIARVLGLSLPTRRMVNLIYKETHQKLKPSPLEPIDKMSSNNYYSVHNNRIEDQILQLAFNPRLGLVGHKKDVVLSLKLTHEPSALAIYGWHRFQGRPIQPLSVAHGAEYADYSHGVRLVSRFVEINNQTYDLFDILTDPDLAWLVSDEGIIPNAPLLMDRLADQLSGQPEVTEKSLPVSLISGI